MAKLLGLVIVLFGVGYAMGLLLVMVSVWMGVL